MSSRPRYITVSELPPRPDPQTGQPKPPPAPGFMGTDKPDKKNPITDPSQAPSPPPGQGPVLAWYKTSRLGAIVAALATCGTFGLITFGGSFALGVSHRWMMLWWLWAVLGLLLALGSYFRRRIDISVGADWLQDRRHWVKLYELTNVTLVGRNSYRGNTYSLILKDRDGHVILIPVNSIQKDRDIWDLVYNGILHSVVIGEAETNRRLHAIINVPRPYPKTG